MKDRPWLRNAFNLVEKASVALMLTMTLLLIVKIVIGMFSPAIGSVSPSHSVWTYGLGWTVSFAMAIELAMLRHDIDVQSAMAAWRRENEL